MTSLTHGHDAAVRRFYHVKQQGLRRQRQKLGVGWFVLRGHWGNESAGQEKYRDGSAKGSSKIAQQKIYVPIKVAKLPGREGPGSSGQNGLATPAGSQRLGRELGGRHLLVEGLRRTLVVKTLGDVAA